jgi:UDP-N-acetylglucosamine pyrophosphorylase
METIEKMALSANGNGDIYESLISSGVYNKLLLRGVEYLQVVSVDNILSKISDPTFFGLVKTNNVDLGVKVISKKHDFENVGVFCEINDKLDVIEYSEIGEKMASQKDDNNERIYDCANISSYIFNLKAMHDCAIKYKLDYHIARKNIKTDLGAVKGIKLELFIFDLFRYFNTYVIAKVERKYEFSPIKNKVGEDSPETAIRDYKLNQV